MGSSIRTILVLTFLNYHLGYCGDISIMLSSSEETALNHAVELCSNRQNGQVKSPSHLRLDGIIYNHETSWTIWLNGRPIKPGQTISTVRIMKVTPENVELMWNPSPGKRYQLFLKPNDVFQTSDDLSGFDG